MTGHRAVSVAGFVSEGNVTCREWVVVRRWGKRSERSGREGGRGRAGSSSCLSAGTQDRPENLDHGVWVLI